MRIRMWVDIGYVNVSLPFKNIPIFRLYQNRKSDYPIVLAACFKEDIYKHIIGMNIKLKFCKSPPSVKDIPLVEER
jgi:hypothetical protein